MRMAELSSKRAVAVVLVAALGAARRDPGRSARQLALLAGEQVTGAAGPARADIAAVPVRRAGRGAQAQLRLHDVPQARRARPPRRSGYRTVGSSATRPAPHAGKPHATPRAGSGPATHQPLRQQQQPSRAPSAPACATTEPPVAPGPGTGAGRSPAATHPDRARFPCRPRSPVRRPAPRSVTAATAPATAARRRARNSQDS